MTVPADSPLARLLTQAGHPLPSFSVALKGEVPLEGGGRAPAWLCATDRIALLVGTMGDAGAIVDLGRTPLRYQRRTLGDVLEVEGQSYGVPFGQGDATRRALATARIRAAAQHPDEAPQPIGGPFVDAASTLEEHWLSGALPDGEPVIAWLTTGETHTFSDSIDQSSAVTATMRLLISGDRACLVAVSELGDRFTRELPLLPIELSGNRVSRDTATVGEAVWRLARGGAERLRPLQRLTALRRPQRLREAARLLALTGDADASAHATRLLDAVGSPEALDRLSRDRLRGTVPDETLAAVMAELVAQDSDGGRLSVWLRDWVVPLEDSRRFLAAAMAALPPERAAWALPVHRHVLELHRAAQEPQPVQAAVELQFAEHLLLAERRAEATSVLEQCRIQLPDEELQAVLPPPDADLTAGEGGQPLHLRALELLAVARGNAEQPDPQALAELARHQPLLPARLQALGAVQGRPELAQRAQQALAALQPGGLQLPPAPEAPLPPHALRAEQVELLRHPVARESGALGRLQAALARVAPPDQGTLRDYCERVSPRKHPEVIAAIADACVMLGMPAVPAYISMGNRKVGIRSHEKPEPFLLIGGAHLDPEADVYLHPAELRAALGAELAHLRFQHSRITSDDLWAGVWDKGTAALEAGALVLPFMKYLPVDFLGRQTTYRVVSSVVPLEWLKRIYALEDSTQLADAVADNLGKLGEAAGSAVGSAAGSLTTTRETAERLLPGAAPPARAEDADVGLDGRRVLAAHRAMQLTADRAALLLADGAAVAVLRSMFLLHSRLVPELAIAERAGLHTALARRGPDGRLLLPELALRSAALLAFLLSDDYTRLRAALRGEAAG